MKNPLVTGHDAREITEQVSKLLRDVGNPEPPLSLQIIRDRLKLDLRYYSTVDHSFVRDAVHAIKVAGKQVLQRPTLLIDAVRRFDLRALWLPDRKRILIDQDLHPLKHRWAEVHETAHAIIPWHADYLLGDADTELSPTCCATIEAEANYACGQILFLQERFVEEVMSLPVTIESLKNLKQRFDNTYTSTLWRMVEEYCGSRPVVGIVSVHPIRLSDDFEPSDPCRYVIQSAKFREEFGKVTEVELFNALGSYCSRKRGGHLGTGQVSLVDDNGQQHEFLFETFCLRYKKPDQDLGFQALTLGVHQRKLSTGAARCGNRSVG
ncbi:MAG: DUF955 domain-containing protein [Planctomycetes bacterium]|nr:DUF955 domain-containing protein [Planctomycetota bacterium]